MDTGIFEKTREEKLLKQLGGQNEAFYLDNYLCPFLMFSVQDGQPWRVNLKQRGKQTSPEVAEAENLEKQSSLSPNFNK